MNKGIELQPESASAQNGLGVALARTGRLEDAVVHMDKAVVPAPQAVDYRYNFGRVLAAKDNRPRAVVQFEEAARLSGMQEPAILEMLAATYSDTGRNSRRCEQGTSSAGFGDQAARRWSGGEIEGASGALRRVGPERAAIYDNALTKYPGVEPSSRDLLDRSAEALRHSKSSFFAAISVERASAAEAGADLRGTMARLKSDPSHSR